MLKSLVLYALPHDSFLVFYHQGLNDLFVRRYLLDLAVSLLS